MILSVTFMVISTPPAILLNIIRITYKLIIFLKYYMRVWFIYCYHLGKIFTLVKCFIFLIKFRVRLPSRNWRTTNSLLLSWPPKLSTTKATTENVRQIKSDIKNSRWKGIDEGCDKSLRFSRERSPKNKAPSDRRWELVDDRHDVLARRRHLRTECLISQRVAVVRSISEVLRLIVNWKDFTSSDQRGFDAAPKNFSGCYRNLIPAPILNSKEILTHIDDPPTARACPETKFHSLGHHTLQICRTLKVCFC